MFTKALTASALLATLITGTAASAYDGHQRWFAVSNVGDFSIMYVRATHVDDTDWGGDLLGSSQIIPVGATEYVEPHRHNGYCMFDIKVEFADDSYTTAMNVNLCEITEIVVDDWGNYSLRY